ncbi:hypothetical protein AV530_011705 [Patagioenas fasciata monilis]|nr:hypothetical protein AV530_011705 [Patagioenas fasciata monilis]
MYSLVDQDLISIVVYSLHAMEKCSSGWVYPSDHGGHSGGFSGGTWPGGESDRFQGLGELVPPLTCVFDLVCDRKDLNDISQSIYMMGMFLGSMIFGPLSDRIGRRPVILISIFLQGLFGVAIAFVPHFYVYMAFRCVVGASVSGITMTILALGSVPLYLNFRFADSLVYYGLSLNVTHFGLDIYLTQLAFGAVELPARFGCIFLLQWFGRKKCQVVLLLLSGIMCLIITVIPEDQPVVTTVLAIIGKFTATAAFSTSYVYTAELFPTVVRQTGVGLCSMSARVAGILAPLIHLLAQYHAAIPMAIYGSAPVLGGLLCILLPETRGTDLADDTRAATPQPRSVEDEHEVSV